MTELISASSDNKTEHLNEQLVRTNRVIFEQEALLTNWGITCFSGSGEEKDVRLAEMLFTYSLLSNPKKPPVITLIHNSGRGQAGDFIDSVSEGLVEDKEQIRAHKVMRNDINSAINPFDTYLGFRKPTGLQAYTASLFLKNIFSFHNDDLSLADQPYQAIADDLIKKVYEMTTSEQPAIPKYYQKGYHKALDEVVVQHNIKTDDAILAAKLRDILHLKGAECTGDEQRELWLARDHAHKQAMPVLDDLLSVIEACEAQDGFIAQELATDPLVQHIKGYIKNTIVHYPCFSSPTKFDVEQVSVVAIDLKDVIKPDDAYNNALFFQVAHKVAVDKVFLTEYDVAVGDIDGVYADLHYKRMRRLHEGYKVIAVDGIDLAEHAMMLSSTAREQRKRGVRYILSVECLAELMNADLSNSYSALAYATRLFLFSKPTEDEVTFFNRAFDRKIMTQDDLQKIDSKHYLYHAVPQSGQRGNFIELALCEKKTMNQKESLLLKRQFEDRGLIMS
ncbi:hypothetical protein [Psychrobacter sp. UBA3480]|uniref:hypothetical protein n=1 Tax=Psychrobacter sp. UBA3480 TaxID=1947350 RepID=UPI0025F33291|nr:hypothetical protein [Psychrobacter sp. UBA3480]